MVSASIYIKKDLEDALQTLDTKDPLYCRLNRELEIFDSICVQMHKCFAQLMTLLQPKVQDEREREDEKPNIEILSRTKRV